MDLFFERCYSECSDVPNVTPQRSPYPEILDFGVSEVSCVSLACCRTKGFIRAADHAEDLHGER